MPVTSYPRFSTAFLRMSSPTSLSYAILALPFERLTSALMPSIPLSACVTSSAQCAQFIPEISIVFFPMTGPSSFFFGTFHAPGQFPPAGQPMHFTPFLFDLTIYAAAPPIKTARIMTEITFAMKTHPFLSNAKWWTKYFPLSTADHSLY